MFKDQKTITVDEAAKILKKIPYFCKFKQKRLYAGSGQFIVEYGRDSVKVFPDLPQAVAFYNKK